MGSRFCKSCNAEIPDGQPGICPKCGAAPSASDIKNTVLAAVLSLIIPGLGQSYNGNALKGIGFFFGNIILWTISLAMYFFSGVLYPDAALLIVIFVIWIIGVYDAYRDAGMMNRGEIPEKKHRMLLFGGVAVVLVILLAVGVAFFIIYLVASMDSPPPLPNDKTAEMRVLYNGSVYASYGSVDCFSQNNITGPTVIRFATTFCHIRRASFRKSDTQPGELRVELVRDGRVVKSYSTDKGEINFRDVDGDLQFLSKEPGLIQQTPVTVRVLTDGEWSGWISDPSGYQSDSGSGPSTLTLNQPLLLVEACVSNTGNSTTAALAVELYHGETLLKRSDIKDEKGWICMKSL